MLFWSTKKISRKFLLAIMLVAIVPIGVLGINTLRLAEKALMEFASLHMRTILKDHERHLEAWLQERSNDVRTFSSLPAIKEAITAYRFALANGAQTDIPFRILNETLAVAKEKSPSYANLSVVLPEGGILWSSQDRPIDFTDPQLVDFIQRLTGSEFPLFGSLCEGGWENWHILAGSSIRDQEGRSVAVMIAVLDSSKVFDPLIADHIIMGETGEIYMIDESGRIISGSRSNAELKTPLSDIKHSALVDKKDPATYTNYMGREVLGSLLWLSGSNFGFVAEVEIDEILRPLKSIKVMSLLLIVFVSLVCLILALAVSKKVAEPISNVAGAALRIADGELEQRISFSGSDEVGLLAQSFNKMAQRVSLLVSSLRQREQSLQKAYDSLIGTQDQLIQSEKMATIGEVVACVAHEMRNPLSSIKLNLEIIGTELEGDPTMGEHCMIALSQTVQLERMFSDLLNYSKPLILHKSSAAIMGLVGKSIDQLWNEIAAREIEIVKKIPQELPFIHVDSDMIVQMLVNLLKNAVDASQRGGRIEIEVKPNGTKGQEALAISVTDNGSGIPARSLQKIFEPFFTTGKEGTGLGLCIVKKIVDMHRGQIFVISEEGKGTTMSVSLPIS